MKLFSLKTITIFIVLSSINIVMHAFTIWVDKNWGINDLVQIEILREADDFLKPFRDKKVSKLVMESMQTAVQLASDIAAIAGTVSTGLPASKKDENKQMEKNFELVQNLSEKMDKLFTDATEGIPGLVYEISKKIHTLKSFTLTSGSIEKWDWMNIKVNGKDKYGRLFAVILQGTGEDMKIAGFFNFDIRGGIEIQSVDGKVAIRTTTYKNGKYINDFQSSNWPKSEIKPISPPDVKPTTEDKGEDPEPSDLS